jgi:hypothetical protein
MPCVTIQKIIITNSREESIMQPKRKIIWLASGLAAITTIAFAATQTRLTFSTPIQLSNPSSLGYAFKTKLARTASGMLVMVYGDATDATKVVYDVKGDVDRPARDIFVRTCDSVNTDCSVEANWSAEVNVSNTVAQSSINTDWDGSTDASSTRKAYYGDSDKPNIINAGTRVQITWGDKYCPGGAQRTVTYLTRDSREIPFSCLYVVDSSDNGLNWSTATQLTDGSRDVKQDASKIASDGHSIITWQEDPLGLELGAGDGPGDGASGAGVHHGTDVWHTYAAPWAAGATPTWAAPARLTDNNTANASGDYDVIKDSAGTVVDSASLEGGIAGASRPNVALVGPTAIVAYEETKGAGGLDEGKFVRYHSFTYNDAAGTNNAAGCIISDPVENARRVRFVTQATPGTTSGMTMGIFWKQGNYDQGGPADIVLRRGIMDFTAANMVPAVDSNCETSDYNTAIGLNNTPAVNLSSQTPTATAANLGDITDANNIENALAHRGLIRGDDLYVGYSYTPDWAVATYTMLENYNFWLRHYDGATDTWTNPQNLSNISDKGINVREPRLVGTPSAPDQDTSAFIIAWGTQTNVPEHLGGAEDLEIYYTRTFDKGANFEQVVTVPNPNNDARFESQLRPTPDGQTVYMAWNEDTGTATNAMLSEGVTETYDDGSSTTTSSGSSGGGCSYKADGRFDPALPALVLLALGYLGWSRRKGMK